MKSGETMVGVNPLVLANDSIADDPSLQNIQKSTK